MPKFLQDACGVRMTDACPVLVLVPEVVMHSTVHASDAVAGTSHEAPSRHHLCFRHGGTDLGEKSRLSAAGSGEMVARIILVGHINGTGKFQVDGSDGEQSNTPYDD